MIPDGKVFLVPEHSTESGSSISGAIPGLPWLPLDRLEAFVESHLRWDTNDRIADRQVSLRQSLLSLRKREVRVGSAYRSGRQVSPLGVSSIGLWAEVLAS